MPPSLTALKFFSRKTGKASLYLLLSIMSSIWRCYICYIDMPVAYGPYHLVEADHIERLIARLANSTLSIVDNSTSNSFTPYGRMEEEYALAYPKKSAPVSTLNEPTLARSHGPIDEFFESFPSFKYNPSLTPSISYGDLQKHQKWLPKSPESKESWESYQRALRREFNRWFCAGDELEAWHSLCRAIRINPLPKTPEECKVVSSYYTHLRWFYIWWLKWQVVHNRHVNMIDLIQWARSGGEANSYRVKDFPTVRELSEYSLQTNKIFRRKRAKNSEEDGIVFRHLLRHLLRHIYSPKPDDHVFS